MRAWQRLAAAVVLAGALGAGTAATASAVAVVPNQPGVSQGATSPNPAADAEGGDGGSGLLGSVLGSLCSDTKAPTPQSPISSGLNIDRGIRADGPIGGTAPVTPTVNTSDLYGTYGTAGLFWTTYDTGCISTARVDTSTGTSVNSTLNDLDSLVNDLQAFVLDPEAGMPYDPFLISSIEAVHDALWDPWVAVALVGAGLVIALMVASGNTGAGISAAACAVIVLGSVAWVTSNPTAYPAASDKITAGVTTKVGETTLARSGADMTQDTPANLQAETYYRATSWQSWTKGMFCGDTAAAAKYGPIFLDAQAFSRAQWEATRNDPAAQTALVTAKKEKWLAGAAGLKTDFPVAFGCWSGETNTRTSAAGQHAVVTVLAGSMTVTTAGAVGILRVVARIVPILIVGFGVLMLLSRRVLGAFLELAVLGLVGPPVVAAIAGIILFGFTSTLIANPDQWWRSLVASLFLFIGFFVLRKQLGRIVNTLGSIEMTSAGMRRAARGNTHRSHRSSGGGASAGGTALAAAAGAAAGAQVGGDERRASTDGDAAGGVPWEHFTPVPVAPTGGDEGRAQHVNADYPDQTPVWVSRRSDGGTQIDIGAEPGAYEAGPGSPFQPVAPTGHSGDDGGRAMADQSQYAYVGAADDGGQKMMDRQQARIAQYREQAQAAGTPPTGGWLGANAPVGGDERRP